MTDSEDEREVNSNCTVSRLAECALIISLGSVCGLKGLEKVRTKGKGKVSLDRPGSPPPPLDALVFLIEKHSCSNWQE